MLQSYTTPAVLKRLPVLRLVAAVISGLALSAAFPPLNWWPLAVVGLVPIIAVPQPRRWLERLLVGFVFGYAHFATALHWLNTVGFGAGWMLAAYCALYPMLWYCWLSSLVWAAKPPEFAHAPGAALCYTKNSSALPICLLAAAGWTALEWIRGWLGTGIPWDLLGYAYAESQQLRQLAAVGGVYALSFFSVFVAAVCADMGLAPDEGRVTCDDPLQCYDLCKEKKASHKIISRSRPSTYLALAIMGLGVGILCVPNTPATPDKSLRVLAIQGDLPVQRAWDDAIFDYSWYRYAALTRDALAATTPPPDLILWPEGAMPASITHAPYATRLRQLLAERNVPILLGALDVRVKSQQDYAIFNSVFLLNAGSQLLRNPLATREDYYDKIHLVPFGEYVPFSKYFPGLVELIGMGRDLTPGKNYKLFDLSGAATGVNICFEDVFPEISRRFTQDGAQLLMTVTNDCWYLQSSGARQHRNHAIFRAVENQRPLMRSGNNSDTCLILPDGKVVEPINGGNFGKGWHCYTIPFASTPKTTIYTRYGDVLPLLSGIACAAAFVVLHLQWRKRKKQMQKAK